jgi:hypothetical protein
MLEAHDGATAKAAEREVFILGRVSVVGFVAGRFTSAALMR